MVQLYEIAAGTYTSVFGYERINSAVDKFTEERNQFQMHS